MSNLWLGEASDPAELADEIAAVPASVLRLPHVDPVEIVTFTLTSANRALLVAALRKQSETTK